MTRVLLVLPTATYKATAFLDAATRLGVDVVVGSERKQALASVMGDRFMLFALDDPVAAAEQVARFSERAHVDAIVAVDDRGAVSGAAAAQRLSLVHNDPDAVAATRNKVVMRTRLAKAHVPQPSWSVLSKSDDPGEVARTIGYPAVLKPAARSASQGVIRVDDVEQAREAARTIAGILGPECGDEEILVERFIPGDEIAIEALLVHGELRLLACFDKPDPLDGPYFEETIYVTPSRHPPEVITEALGIAETAARAIGLSEGPVHIELRLPPSEFGLGPAVVLELAARTIGGRCSSVLEFDDGATLEQIVLAHSLGRDVDHPRLQGAAGVMMVPIPSAGRLSSVTGIDAALEVPGITGCELTVPIGGRVVPVPEGDRYLGFLFARAESPELAEQALRLGFDKLQINVRGEPA